GEGVWRGARRGGRCRRVRLDRPRPLVQRRVARGSRGGGDRGRVRSCRSRDRRGDGRRRRVRDRRRRDRPRRLPLRRAHPPAGSPTVRRRDADDLRDVLGGRGCRCPLARRGARARVARGRLRDRCAPPRPTRDALANECRTIARDRSPVDGRSRPMIRLGRWIRAFVLFWVDFVVGDDWRVAAVIALALLGTWGLVRADVAAWWLLPVAVLAATVRSLRAAVLRERP